MSKWKGTRVTMISECTSCIRNGVTTQKNRHNTPKRLELRKLCPYFYKHMIHGAIKK